MVAEVERVLGQLCQGKGVRHSAKVPRHSRATTPPKAAQPSRNNSPYASTTPWCHHTRVHVVLHQDVTRGPLSVGSQ
eukprot:3558164-Prymnesium_polylepis.2